jgi:iron complex outermembrane receptor protein
LYDRHYLELETGLGYGERAPSVSEGYGYYLFNSFDRFDYIGNPDLKNERSLEMNARLKWKKEKFFLQISSSYFRQFNYIIGVPDPDISVMTLGANGVKIYTALQAASIYTSECSAEYRPHTSLKLRASLSYNLGRDDQGENLPLIRPFSFTFGVAYKYRAFDAELTVEGAAKQSAFSAGYGEDLTPAYAVLNFSAGYMLLKNSHRVYFRTGIENIANTRYSTFSDWNNIPAKGINFFFHISYLFDRKKPAQKNDQPVVKAG